MHATRRDDLDYQAEKDSQEELSGFSSFLFVSQSSQEDHIKLRVYSHSTPTVSLGCLRLEDTVISIAPLSPHSLLRLD